MRAGMVAFPISPSISLDSSLYLPISPYVLALSRSPRTLSCPRSRYLDAVLDPRIPTLNLALTSTRTRPNCP